MKKIDKIYKHKLKLYHNNLTNKHIINIMITYKQMKMYKIVHNNLMNKNNININLNTTS